MSDPPAPAPSDDLPPEAPVPPLEAIVDDLTPRQECADWIHEQLAAGRPASDVTEELISTGWDRDDAEILVEYVRRATRRERGVTTREDVLRRVNQSYRQSWRLSWFSGFLAFASGVRLIGAIRNLRSLWRSGQDK